MTLTQLEYIIALDTYRHFGDAANHCHVTQPTLSAQIQKLEEQLGVKIFDRSKQPVTPTEQGYELIEQAKKIIVQRDGLLETIAAQKGIVNGTLRLGIIPTLAPYLLPLFINNFIEKYPGIKLYIQEFTTENLLLQLRDNRIDVGLLVTPLNEPFAKEQVLFYEQLIAYVSPKNSNYYNHTFSLNTINPQELWLLEDGHCFKSQMMQLCGIRGANLYNTNFKYEASNLDTLRKMVDNSNGITILPELATLDLSAESKLNLRFFEGPAPVREVSLVTNKSFIKKKLIDVLSKEIIAHLPPNILKNSLGNKITIPKSTQ